MEGIDFCQWALDENLREYTGCPQKRGTLDFRYFDIRKYSDFIR